MSKKEKDEQTTAASIVAENRLAEQEYERQPKQNIFQRVTSLVGTVQDVGSNVNEFYTNWIKPVYDNRAQIARRLNAVTTIVSLVFFLLYVPFLLFSNISAGLAQGWDIALYCCIAVYAVATTAMLVITFLSGKSTSTEMATKYKRIKKIAMYCARIASVAIAITALAITASADPGNVNAALRTVGIVFSIVSIVFSALPLIFGSFTEFFKWLISPAKIKRTVSFVALEWYDLLTSTADAPKTVHRVDKKYFDAIAASIDNYILPELGDKYANGITSGQVYAMITGASDADRELLKAVTKNIFNYALDCGYAQDDPCAELGLSDSIEQAVQSDFPDKKQGFLSRLFGRRE